MSRRNQLNPMRFLVLLAVTWAAGTLLFAAEQTPRATPEATAPAAATPTSNSAKPPANEPADPSVAQAEPAVQAAEPEAEEPVAAEQRADESEAEESEASPVQEEGEKPQRASAADKGSPKRFVPSEQVRADFDVSFPIDI